MDLQYSWVCTACISATPPRIPFLSHTWKEHILELCNGRFILIFLENWGNEKSLKKCKNFIYILAIFMDLYGLYLSNPSTDLILLLHMERAYIRAVQWGVNFDFSWKLKEWEIFKIMWNCLYRLAIFMCLYGLYLRNPSTDFISLLHMERTYIWAVQRDVNFDFSWILRKWEIYEKCKISCLNLQYSWVCTACISVTPHWIPFLSRTWKEHILELCNGRLILIFLEFENLQKKKNKTCDMLHQDFHVNKFVLPQCLTVFCYTVMWYWFAFNCIP